MPSGKAPGPGDFPVEFYQIFWPMLAPIFHRMVKDIEETPSLPSNMNCTDINLLLKPDKDPAHLASYRPISLILNDHLKMICKALASRIEKVSPYLKHPDQTGFIKSR